MCVDVDLKIQVLHDASQLNSKSKGPGKRGKATHGGKIRSAQLLLKKATAA